MSALASACQVLWPALASLTTFLATCESSLRVIEEAAKPDPSPERLRVIDFNVLHGYPDFPDQEGRFQDTMAAFQALQPDLLILQEAWTTPRHGSMAKHLGKALHMNYVYARANGSRRLIGFEEGSAILSRFPILEAERFVLPPRQPFWENRIAVVAWIKVAGEELTIAGTHLTYHSDASTTDQVASLLKHLPKDNLLFVAGDFNAQSDSPAVESMTRAGFKDALPGDINHLFVPNEEYPLEIERHQCAGRSAPRHGQAYRQGGQDFRSCRHRRGLCAQQAALGL